MTTMRLPDGSEVAFVDWQDKPLWSTLDLLTGFSDAELYAFTYVAGDPVPASNNASVRRTSSGRDTNVSTPGSMASTEELLVYAIKPYFLEYVSDAEIPTDMSTVIIGQAGQPTPSTSRLAVLNSALTLRLIVSQKVEQEAPLPYFNTGFGTFSGAQNAVGVVGTIPRGSAGMPTQEAVRSYAIPVHIGGQEKYRVGLFNDGGVVVDFGVDETTPPNVADNIVMQVMIHLDGLYKRPVT
jgi:hypothetical protein